MAGFRNNYVNQYNNYKLADSFYFVPIICMSTHGRFSDQLKYVMNG